MNEKEEAVQKATDRLRLSKKNCCSSIHLLTFCVVLAVLSAVGPVFSQPLAIDFTSIKAVESGVTIANEERRQAHWSRNVIMKFNQTTERINNQAHDASVNTFQNVVAVTSATYLPYIGGFIECFIVASEHELRPRILNDERARQDVRLSAWLSLFHEIAHGRHVAIDRQLDKAPGVSRDTLI